MSKEFHEPAPLHAWPQAGQAGERVQPLDPPTRRDAAPLSLGGWLWLIWWFVLATMVVAGLAALPLIVLPGWAANCLGVGVALGFFSLAPFFTWRTEVKRLRVLPAATGADAAAPRTWTLSGKVWMGWHALLTVLLLIGFALYLAERRPPQEAWTTYFSLLSAAAFMSLFLQGIWFANRARLLGMAESAMVMGFRFSEQASARQLGPALAVPWLREVRKSKARFWMAGAVGDWQVMFFDWFDPEAAKRGVPWQTVLLVHGGIDLPEFVLEPKQQRVHWYWLHLLMHFEVGIVVLVLTVLSSFFSRVRPSKETSDLEVQDRKKFNQRYRVSGRDQVELARRFTPELVDRLLADKKWWKQPWRVQAAGGAAAVLWPINLCPPNQLHERLADTLRFLVLVETFEPPAPPKSDAWVHGQHPEALR